MKKLAVPNSVSRAFHKVGFQLKKHSPEILVVAGIVGGVTSAVLACKATTKVSGILEESKGEIDKIHMCLENPEMCKEEYTVEDSKKDLAIVYAQTGVKLIKTYGPAIALGTLSVTSILAGHNILRKRNVALAAAYTAVDTSFKDYRKRVVERFGKELDRELKYNIKAKEIEETVINEDGSEAVTKKTVNVVDPTRHSEFAVIYDDGCKGWDKDPEVNKYFLLKAQEYANQKLQAQGYLYLNEVYDMLGFPRTKAGQVVGWIYDTKNPTGDNCVDFLMFDIHDERKRAFINGYETNVLLDFNVDGNIWELMR